MFAGPPFAVPALTILLIAFVPGLMALLGWWVWRLRAAPSHGTSNLDTLTAWPPSATRVLAQGEREAYELLRLALPGRMVLAQVPLHRFIKVPTRNSYSEWLRRVGRLHVDLVVCDRHSQVLAAIEIAREDDVPGSRAQHRRDRMIRVLRASEIPVHVWRASALPSADAVREAILPGSAPADFQPTAAHVQASGLTTGSAIAGLDGAHEEEPMGLREPPPSTWFDDLDSASAPLAGAERQRLESSHRPLR